MKRTAMRLGAVTAAAALVTMSTAPAQAATASQASATALRVSVAGHGSDSGTVVAVNDGSGEHKTGSTNPPVSVLQRQQLLNVGVLAQDATARVGDDGRGTSFACAGVAGNGASVAEVGDSSCLTPGNPVGLSLANLDLSDSVLVNPESALGPLSGPLQQAWDPVVDAVTPPLSSGLDDNLGPLEIGGTLGAVEARCVAGPGELGGRANIVDSRLTATIAGQTVVLAHLPAYPPPNTRVVTDLDVVLHTILDAVEADLRDSLRGELAPGIQLTDALRTQVVDTLVRQVADQLQPLEDNVVEIVLNEQQRSADRIRVTAISLDVLPAAKQFAGFPLVSADVAEVTCGPNGRHVAPKTAAAPPAPAAPGGAALPTAVASGVAGGSGWGDDWGSVALAGLLLTAVSGGVIGYRRSLSR